MFSFRFCTFSNKTFILIFLSNKSYSTLIAVCASPGGPFPLSLDSSHPGHHLFELLYHQPHHFKETQLLLQRHKENRTHPLTLTYRTLHTTFTLTQFSSLTFLHTLTQCVIFYLYIYKYIYCIFINNSVFFSLSFTN